MRLDTIHAVQERLIAALDAGDAQDIMAATSALSSLLEDLRDTPALYASPDTRAALERIDTLSQAAAYRLRILTDNTRRRLALLGRESEQLAYGPRIAVG
jgi:hypothetical protein